MNFEELTKRGFTIDVINLDDFNGLLVKYKDVVPDKLEELEKQRLEIIPKALAERTDAHLTKTEVQTLLDWKLYVWNDPNRLVKFRRIWEILANASHTADMAPSDPHCASSLIRMPRRK